MIVCYVICYALQLIMYLGRSNPWRTSGGEFTPELTLQSNEQAFEVEYTHNSTAIEGNTLTWKGREMNPMELAAWTHVEFVKIYPFPEAVVG